jgi:hypothetical protein
MEATHMTNAFEVMREWDVEAGMQPRSDEDLLLDVPGGLTCRVFSGDWDEWIAALEANDISAILEGRAMWGLPPL